LPKSISGGSSKRYFQEKSSRKIVFWDSDEVRPELGTEKVNHRIVQPAVEGSDEQQEAVKSESDQGEIFRIKKKTSVSGKFTSDVILSAPKSISVKRKMAQKEASEQNVDFDLRMDFVECKCKFGLNDVITPWQSVNTVVEFPFLEAEEGHITSDQDVKANPEPVLHPGGSESINLGLVQGLGALSQHGEPSVDLLDQEHPEKYQNSDDLLLQQVIGGPLFYSDTRKLRKEDGF